jgi:hypothetical protein
MEFTAVGRTGSRHAGRTTLLRLCEGSDRYAWLEIPDVRAAAVAEPGGFPGSYASPVTFDEVRYAPERLPHIKGRVDATRDVSGRYSLTGSLNLLLAESVTGSLAGRAAILRLFSLARREAEGRPQLALPWQAGREEPSCSLASFAALWEAIRSLPRAPAGIWLFGKEVTYRRTSNGMSARSGRWGI